MFVETPVPPSSVSHRRLDRSPRRLDRPRAATLASALLFASLPWVATVAEATTLPDALLHLPLDAVSGGTSPDLSEHGADAVVGADVSTVASPIGGGVQLAAPGGSAGHLDDGLHVPQVGDGSPFAELSISLWYRADPTDHDGYLLAWGGSYNAPDHVSLYLDSGRELRLRVHDSSDTWSVQRLAPTGFQDGGWHHLVVVKDDAGTTVYFDGAALESSSHGEGPLAIDGSLFLGTNPTGRWGSNSALDELQIVPRALDAADVATLFAAGSGAGGGGGGGGGGGDADGGSDPILHLPLDEASGSVATDLSGFDHHAVIGDDAALGVDGAFGTAIESAGPGRSAGDLADGLQVPSLAGGAYDSLSVAFWYRARLDESGYLFHWGGSYRDPDSVSIYLDNYQGLLVRAHATGEHDSRETIQPTGYDDGAWHHVAVTNDTTGTRIYFDGVEQAASTMGAGAIHPPTGIGLGTNENGRWGLTAAFDEVRVWDRALTASEVAALYAPITLGSLTVDLTPTEAVAAGARWRLSDGPDASWRESGDRLTVGDGSYTLDFQAVPGWIAPPAEVVVVTARTESALDRAYVVEPPKPPPILHLPFDEPRGSAIAGDLSGNGHDAVLGARVLAGLEGVGGTALQTASPGGNRGDLDDGVTVADLAADDAYDELTMAFWYRLPAEPVDGYLVAWGGANGDPNSLSVWLDVGSELRVRIHDGGDSTSVISVAPSGFDDTAWHHLALIKDAAGSRVAFDGVEVATATSGQGTIAPAAGISLGVRDDGRFGLEATYDDLRVWDRALAPYELAALVSAASPPSGLAHYRTVDAIHAHLAATEAAYPSLVELVDFGDSRAKADGGTTLPGGWTLDGDDLVAVRVTRRDLAATSGDKPVFVLMACLHAREIATPEIALRFLDHLVDGYGNDPDVTWLVEHHEVWILPLVNPDGHRMVERGALPEHGARPWSWRKNVHVESGSCTWPPPDDGSTFGVDLNRNFSTAWGTQNGQAGASFTCSPYYYGQSGASEPETIAIESLLRSLLPDQRGIGTTDAAPDSTTGVFVQLHSPFRTVAWPWAHTDTPAPNAAGLETIGEKLAALSGYSAGQAHSAVYSMTGTADDWVYGELGVPAYLIEVGEGLMPAYHRVENVIWNETRDALLYAAKIARAPYRDARGPDIASIQVTSLSGATELTVTVTDTRDIGQPGQAIAEVEASLTPPWEAGASPIALVAQDGAFDSPTEVAVGTVEPDGLQSGSHLVWLRARNASGDWGPPGAAWITVP